VLPSAKQAFKGTQARRTSQQDTQSSNDMHAWTEHQ